MIWCPDSSTSPWCMQDHPWSPVPASDGRWISARTSGSSASCLSGRGLWRCNPPPGSRLLQKDSKRRDDSRVAGGGEWCPWLMSAVGHRHYSLETVVTESSFGLMSQNLLSRPVPLVTSNVSAATYPHTAVLLPPTDMFQIWWPSRRYFSVLAYIRVMFLAICN